MCLREDEHVREVLDVILEHNFAGHAPASVFSSHPVGSHVDGQVSLFRLVRGACVDRYHVTVL